MPRTHDRTGPTGPCFVRMMTLLLQQTRDPLSKLHHPLGALRPQHQSVPRLQGTCAECRAGCTSPEVPQIV